MSTEVEDDIESFIASLEDEGRDPRPSELMYILRSISAYESGFQALARNDLKLARSRGPKRARGRVHVPAGMVQNWSAADLRKRWRERKAPFKRT